MESNDNKRLINNLSPSDLIGILSALIGAIVGLFSYITNPVLAGLSIISAQLLLIIGLIYIYYHLVKFRDTVRNKNKDIDKLSEKLKSEELEYDKKKEQLEKEREHIIKQLSVISNSVKNNNIHSNDILVRIPSGAEDQYVVLENLKTIAASSPGDDTVRRKLQSQAKASAEKYAGELFGVFNRYCRELTDEAIKLHNAYLALRKIPLSVSITIKLMDKPFHPGVDNVDEIRVYTGFRDNNAYSEGDREIGEQTYSISGNTAFITCTRKDCFIINNSLISEGSYINEHRRYDEFYDCAVVVPIKLKRPDGQYKYFGFLCCDCLNSIDSTSQVFDKSASQYLFAFAQNMATFLETLDSNWIDRYMGFEGVSSNILEMLSKKICKNKT